MSEKQSQQDAEQTQSIDLVRVSGDLAGEPDVKNAPSFLKLSMFYLRSYLE